MSAYYRWNFSWIYKFVMQLICKKQQKLNHREYNQIHSVHCVETLPCLNVSRWWESSLFQLIAIKGKQYLRFYKNNNKYLKQYVRWDILVQNDMLIFSSLISFLLSDVIPKSAWLGRKRYWFIIKGSFIPWARCYFFCNSWY